MSRVQVRSWIEPEERRKMERRREQLGGMSESEYVRRLIRNACAGIPSEPDVEV